MVPSVKTRWNILLPIAVAVMLAGPVAKADTVTEWNRKAGDILVDSGLGPLPVDRALAIVHASVYEAVNAITRRYPIGDVKLKAAPGASIDAAIASANRAALVKLVPSRLAEIDVAYQAALITIADGRAKTEGITVGNEAAAAILAMRAGDGATAGETYRPRTSPGVYVPTVIPEAPQWAKMKPWLMTNPAQFRPGPPSRPGCGAVA